MYYFIYGLLWLISLLPLRVLYILSDGIYGFIFYVIKYRRDVVLNNLCIVFPDKTQQERKLIAKKFYHNFIDTFIETIKMITVSEKFLEKRFSANWEVVNNLKSTGKKVQLHLGHNFNWEWGNAICAKKLNFPFVAVYMPIANKIIDRFFRRMRSRNGTLLVRATKMGEDMLPYRNVQYLLGLVADQNPGRLARGLWFNFFGRPTPFLSQPAKYAITNDCAVVFAFIHKKKRGYYEAVFTVVEENPQQTNHIELTGKFVRYMEDVIRQYPDMWLWSHRRWKHEWKEEYGEVRE